MVKKGRGQLHSSKSLFKPWFIHPSTSVSIQHLVGDESAYGARDGHPDIKTVPNSVMVVAQA